MITIEFDGGTSCNIPSRGYGDGYGSFKIGDREVERIEHRRPMSCNVAEIMTAVVALDRCRHFFGSSEILLRGDSKIALNWANIGNGRKPILPNKKKAESFRNAVSELIVAIRHHKNVKTEWRNRNHSVTLFGH